LSHFNFKAGIPFGSARQPKAALSRQRTGELDEELAGRSGKKGFKWQNGGSHPENGKNGKTTEKRQKWQNRQNSIFAKFCRCHSLLH